VVQDDARYSGGVRQELHRLAGQLQQEGIQILDGRVNDYMQRVLRSRCAAPLPDARPARPSHRARSAAACDTQRLPPVLSMQWRPLPRSCRYCLAPYGWGWGMRLSQVILSGCVPVIIQPHVFQPFEDVLDYDAFSVRLPK
jgi:hypothetical protein